MRECHEVALNDTMEFLRHVIGEKKTIQNLTDVNKYYNDCLAQLCTAYDVPVAENTTQALRKKLNEADSKKILTFIIRKGRTLIIPTNDDGDDLTDDYFAEYERFNVAQREAWKIRELILGIERRDLPEKFTIKDIIAGECEIPQYLIKFVTSMATGPKGKRLNNSLFKHKVNSICQDIIYFVTNGGIKTSKHLTLGLTIKSKTNSRDVISILN